MPKVTRLCFARTSLSVALVASLVGFNLLTDPVFAQKKETKDGVTVQKNSDGSVDAYDSGESAQADESTVDSGGGQQFNDGRIHYRPGTSPYEKKYSDGTTVKRNSDGSIETWDEGETHHYTGGLPSGGGGSSHHKRSSKKAKSSTTSKAKASTTAVKKKAK